MRGTNISSFFSPPLAAKCLLLRHCQKGTFCPSPICVSCSLPRSEVEEIRKQQSSSSDSCRPCDSLLRDLKAARDERSRMGQALRDMGNDVSFAMKEKTMNCSPMWNCAQRILWLYAL